MESCKEMGLLLGKGGLWGQTVRFSPPMCLHEQDADFLLAVLDQGFRGFSVQAFPIGERTRPRVPRSATSPSALHEKARRLSSGASLRLAI